MNATTDPVRDGRRADLKDGGGRRRDYGAKGCAGMVYRVAVISMLYVALLAKVVRR